jgi:antitoxin ParD1/3/4
MQHAEKLSITLTPQLAKLVRDSVASGRFASASEVIRDAMRAWQQKEKEHEEAIASIRARVQASIHDPRPSLPLDAAFEEVMDRISQIKAQRQADAA